MKNIFGLLLFFVLSMPIAALPYNLAEKAGEFLGLLVYLLWHKRRRIAVENLKGAVERNALAVSENPEELVKKNFENLGCSLAEVIKLYYGTGGGIVSRVEVEGMDNYRRAKEKGRGVIFIGGHCGNWELLALTFSAKVDKVGVVARPLDNPYLNGLLERTRQRYGNSVIYKQGALRNMISALKSGGIVAILMDQAVLSDEGVVVDFLGAPAWTTRMPATIAKRTSAAVLPIFIRRTEKGHVISIYPEVELAGNDVKDTRKLSGFIEEYIRENPSEWLWLHRRWKSRTTPFPSEDR